MTPEQIVELMSMAEQEIVPPELRAQGWVYRDIPKTFSYEMWDLFLDIMGAVNYQIVCASSCSGWKRGQFLLSPKALENLQKYKNEMHS